MAEKPSERKIKYLQRKKQGYCPRCGGKRRKNSKFIYCDDCRAYYREYNSEISGELNKQRKKRYDRRKAQRQCPRCGKPLGKRYKNLICRPCLDKQYSYNYGKKRPNT